MRQRKTAWVLGVGVVMAGLLAGAPARACDPGVELVITEFMADNVSKLTDPDGDFSDWIEIYNPCLPSVNLDGWYLTDDPDDLTQWRFPNVTLARGGTLLVFASGKNRAVAGSPLHTTFKLSSSGEYLALVKPDGTTIAQAFDPYPPQYPDVSYGFPQTSATTIPVGAQAKYHVPIEDDAALGTDWAAPEFDDASWPAGPTGLGFSETGTGTLQVSYYKANILVPDLATAEGVVADPALHAPPVVVQASTINYLNTGAGSHFLGDLPFPSTQIGVDVNDFVVVVTGSIVIPTTGPWTFGVNSDDGFGLELSRQPYVFTSSYPPPRGPGDTLAVFNVEEAGAYTLRLIFYERGGGSELELFAAPGSFASYNSAFRLVGDTSTGGLGIAGLGAHIGTDVHTPMLDVNASLWTRIAFNVADPGAVDLLSLRMAYEDGFVAYLNGVEAARRNAPAALAWNAAATADRPDTDAGLLELIDLSSQVPLLVTGSNVLSIHGLNDAASNGAFLVLPELKTVGPTSTSTPEYFSTSTPDAHNGTGYPGVSGEPVFSRASGLFSTPFTLELTTAAPGATIRYTLDGSVPSETHGTVYSGAFTVQDSARIRARVFEPGLAPGQVFTRSYVELAADVLDFSSNLPIVVVDTFGNGLTQEFLTETFTSVIPTTGPRASIDDNPGFAGSAGLKIRGSSSTSFPKKQFAVEVWDDTRADLDVPLLGMPTNSDWILYAPYTDKSLMRDFLTYKWSNDIGRYAVRTRFVEVFLRTSTGPLSYSDYAGVYILQEKIKQGPSRVNLVDLQPEDSLPPAVTGGYIMKKDRLDPGDTGFVTSTGLRLAYVEPKEEEITAAQAAYLTGYLNQMESALYGPGFGDPVTGYAAYLDVGAFIDHHILVEMTKNIDGFRLSTFMFKDRGGKLNMGPAWDYNLTMGNANYLEGWLPTGWYHDQIGGGDYPWWPRLFADPEFQLRYADRWFALRAGPFRTSVLLADIDAKTALLGEAQVRNYVRWPILGVYVWPNWYIGATYQDEIDWMKQWLASRLTWMDGQFIAPPQFNHAAGEVPTGFNLTITANAGTIYYTTDGSDPRVAGGAIAAGAAAYSGPVSIVQLLHVKARALDGSTWSAINDATFAPVPPAYVNEVLPVNVTVLADDHGDFDPWIELHNPFTTTADLSGLFLTDNPALPAKWPIPAGTTVCGGQKLLIWSDAEPSEGPLHANFRLSATGGTVWLFNAAALAVDSLTYPALGSNVAYGRNPDGGASIVPFVSPTPGQPNRHIATPIVVNEYNGTAVTQFLSGTGTDSYFGRILGNGGDWFELVVVQDHLDLRGWKAFVSDNSGVITTTLTFTGHALLSDLRSGTIITISGDLATDASYDPAAGDWWINLRASTAADGVYITAANFSVSQNNTQITILNPAGAKVFGPAGEGINPTSGIGNNEVWKLEETAGPTTTAYSNYHDGSSSSFGGPNLWSSGAGIQDFSGLRNPVLATCASAGECADANPCTDDDCVGGHCQNTPNTAACDDGNVCTSNDVCANRACGGAAVPGCCFADCECNDGNACTEGDFCQANACAPGAAVVCDDGNVCTAEVCEPASGSCIATSSGTCGITGTVRYYRDNAGSGLEPSGKLVPNVGIDQTGDGTADTTTDATGAYSFEGVAGDVTIETSVKYGTPRASDHNGGISSFDASVIGRAAVELLELSPNQRIAGDVTGDGTISAFDASLVAQFAAGLVDHFDVATTSGSDWAFVRCDSYAYPGPNGCVTASHAFTPVSGPVTDADFYAVLYGDVTGNWTPSTVFSSAAASPEERIAIESDRLAAASFSREPRLRQSMRPSSGAAVLSLDGGTKILPAGSRRQLSIALSPADQILGLDLTLRYDRTRVTIVGVEPSGIGTGLAVTHREHDGLCRIAAYGAVPLSGTGPVLTVTVEALKPISPETALAIAGTANEGAIPLVTRKATSRP